MTDLEVCSCGAEIVADGEFGPICANGHDGMPPQVPPSEARYIVTTGQVPSREIVVIGYAEAARKADETNGSYRRDW